MTQRGYLLLRRYGHDFSLAQQNVLRSLPGARYEREAYVEAMQEHVAQRCGYGTPTPANPSVNLLAVTDWVTSVAYSFSLHGPRVDCHQPMGGKQLPDFGELGFATHEIRQLCRKIWCNSSFGHPKRRELVAQLGMA